MTLRATYLYQKLHKRTDTKSEAYDKAHSYLYNDCRNDEKSLEDERKETCVDAEKNCECHDYLSLLVNDYFLKLSLML